MHLTNEDDLDGLPESAKDAAAQLAKNKGKKGLAYYFGLSKLYSIYEICTQQRTQKRAVNGIWEQRVPQ